MPATLAVVVMVVFELLGRQLLPYNQPLPRTHSPNGYLPAPSPPLSLYLSLSTSR